MTTPVKPTCWMPLLGRECLIEYIAQRGVIDNSHATLQFLRGGRLAGSATCNRILGPYEKQGAPLSIKTVGTTVMACPEALMSQERQLLNLLPLIKSYRLDEPGALILKTSDGRTVLASRSHRCRC